MKKHMIGIRVSDEERESIRAEAKKEGRTVSNWILNILSRFLKK